MLKDGPFPRFLHGLIEYVAAGLLLVAPFVLDFDSEAATAVSIVAGLNVLFLAAATEGPTSLIDYVPLVAHVVLDYVLAVLLIAMPFIAGFSDETEPTVFFVGLGALHLLLTIGTRFQPRPKDERQARKADRKARRSSRREGESPSAREPS